MSTGRYASGLKGGGHSPGVVVQLGPGHVRGITGVGPDEGDAAGTLSCGRDALGQGRGRASTHVVSDPGGVTAVTAG
jgi:hypothetical protein